MSINEREIIKRYILGEDKKGNVTITDEEKKIRFEIAWDINNYFDHIEWFLKQNVMNKLFELLKEGFVEKYRIVKPKSFWEKGYRHITLSKKDWLLSPDAEWGVLCYCVEYNVSRLYLEITNFDREKGIPFKGNIKENEPDNDILKKAKEINQCFKEVFGKVESGDRWPAFMNLTDRYWKNSKEFYMEILNKEGQLKVAQNIFDEFKKMQEKTELLIDEFVEIYKKENP